MNFTDKIHTRNGRIGINIIASLALKAGAILVSFLLVPATLDYLNKFEYGVWLTLSSIMMWISYFDVGMGNGLRNKLAEALTKGDLALARSYISTTLTLLTLIVTAIYALYFIVHRWIDWPKLLALPTQQLTTDIGHLMLIMLIPFCVGFVLKCLGSIYQAKQMPFVNDLLIGLGSVLSLVSIYVLQWLQPEGDLQSVALCFSFAPMVVYVIAFPITFMRFKELRPKLASVSRKHAQSLLSLGGQFFIIQIASLLLFATANVFVSRYGGAEEVVNYNIAFKYFSVLPMVYLILITPFWSAATEAFTKGDYNWIRYSLHRMLLAWAGLSAIGGIMVICSSLVYQLWVGMQLPLTLSLAMWLYMTIGNWNNLYAYFINGIGRTRVQLYSSVLTCLAYVPLAIYCTQAWGAVGICMAMSISLLFSAILLPIQYRYLMAGSTHWFWSK
ncbi:MAG: MATE family efflux transporter [Bacteroidales bacterium]|nr:MATE family efflux transporter [Bacteroidales bacterium]